jgi:hypothetical protein
VKDHVYLGEDEMVQRAVEALMEILGPIETVRFLTLPRQHRLDSVMRHRQWQGGLDKNSFFDRVFTGDEASLPSP